MEEAFGVKLKAFFILNTPKSDYKTKYTYIGIIIPHISVVYRVKPRRVRSKL